MELQDNHGNADGAGRDENDGYEQAAKPGR
jgi:hypothetical protein